jgi:AraC family transcriptional regulator
VQLEFREEEAGPDLQRALKWRGISAELVSIPGTPAYDYRWVGSTHYLALHDLKLVDGKTRLDSVAGATRLDLRGLLTFAPRGCAATGWSALARRPNSFTALYYDPVVMRVEIDPRVGVGDWRPRLYFDDAGLRSTMTKLKQLLLAPAEADAL